jgi:hypothetical protein
MTEPADPKTLGGALTPPAEASLIFKQLGSIDKAKAGLGWYGHRGGLPGVYEFLEMGSPRMALARALGVPFAPWGVNVTTVFTQTAPAVQSDIGADTKFTQDVYVVGVIGRVINQNTPLNQFQTLSDFFANWQNAFQVKLWVAGSPRYGVFEKWTNLGNALDMLAPDWPRGWVLTYDQQIEMSFQSTVALPAATLPLQIQCTFRTLAPVGEGFSKMTNEDALARLYDACGIEMSAAYAAWHCR